MITKNRKIQGEYENLISLVDFYLSNFTSVHQLTAWIHFYADFTDSIMLMSIKQICFSTVDY